MQTMITIYREDIDSERFIPAMDWAAQRINEFGLTGLDCWLAGGAALHYFMGIEPNDYDFWFEDSVSYQNACNYLTAVPNIANYPGHRLYEYHGPAGEVRIVDLIGNPLFSSPEEIIDRFDFTVAACAINSDSITYHEKYFENLQTRTLELHNLKFPTAILRRLPKYLAKGFTISDRELERLAYALVDVNMDDPEQNAFERSRRNKKTVSLTASRQKDSSSAF